MSAKEMFEKLGYDCYIKGRHIEYLKSEYFNEYEADDDYESDLHYAIYRDGNIMIDVSDSEKNIIKGDNDEDLDLLYDLIKADLVEKVGDDNDRKKNI